jgi:excisionase family DNA binding protein
MPNPTPLSVPPEPFYLTLKEAAIRLGLPYWKLLRACNAGLIPTYKVLNSKRYVRLDEVQAAIAAASQK